MPAALRPPLEPMLAKLARTLPTSGYVYEPKWDGFRAIVFKDGADIDIRSRNDRKLARYFPEIVEAVRALPVERVVLDGELVIATKGGLDFAALMARLHPAASRVHRLRDETPAAFVAFDAIAIGDEDLRAATFAERRARLEALLDRDGRDGRAGRDPRDPRDGALGRAIILTPATSDPAVAARWLERFRSRGIDGVVAKSPSMPYSPGKRTMVKVKHQRTADVVLAGARFMAAPNAGRTPIVASLLLGLVDERGDLVHVGVASQLTAARRAELAAELVPLVTTLEGHPWERGLGLEPSPLGRLAGSAGRWSPDEMDRDWVPLRPERVCEVAYDTVDGHRLRYPARLVRWRPDRDPASCRFEQLDGSDADPKEILWP
jgi:ATP-dependent DNA ligase